MSVIRHGRLVAFAGLVLAQALVVVGLVFNEERMRASGFEILLKSAPVDPRDLLRGDYVILAYEAQTVRQSLLAPSYRQPQPGDEVFVVLRKTGDYWTPAGLSPASGGAPEVEPGAVFLRGTVESATTASTIRVSYANLERFYVPEGTGNFPSGTRPDVVVVVDANGDARIKRLEIGGLPWPPAPGQTPRPRSITATPEAATTPSGSLVRGLEVEAFFKANCAVCHGQNRQGGVGPALTPERLTQPDQFYFDTISNGRPGTAMPSWRTVGLTDQEIRNLVQFEKYSQPSPAGASASVPTSTATPTPATAIREYGPFAATSWDTGSCGRWALESFDQYFVVNTTPVEGKYTVIRELKNGVFVTVAGQSPGGCDTNPGGEVSAGVTGSLEATVELSVSGGRFNSSATCPASCTTRGFISSVFGSAATYVEVAKVWRYTTEHNGEWVDASENRGGRSGDITGVP